MRSRASAAGPRTSRPPVPEPVAGELREVHLAEPEVLARVEHAPVGDRAGVGEQLGASLGLAEAGVAADLLGDLVHLLAGLQEPLGVAAVEVADVERHQPAGGVEHVDGGGVEPGRRSGPRWTAPPRARTPGRASPAIRAACGDEPGPDAGDPVGDHLDQEVVRDRPPRASGRAPPGRGRRDAAWPPGPARRRDRAAPGRPAGDVLGDQVERADRGAALAGEVGRRDQPAHRRPAAAAAGQEGDPGQPGVAEGAARTGCDRQCECVSTARCAALDHRSSTTVGATARSTPRIGRIACAIGRPWRTGPRRRCRRGRSARGRPSPARRPARRAPGGARRRTAGSSRRRRGGGRTGRTTRAPSCRPAPERRRARSARGRSRPGRGTGRRHGPGRRPRARSPPAREPASAAARLPAPAAKNVAHSRELGSHLGEQHPGVLLRGGAGRRARGRARAASSAGGRPQRRDVGQGVAPAPRRW